MGNEPDRRLDAARELLQELERPNAYSLLSVVRETPASELQNEFMQALRKRSETGLSSQVLNQAREQLMNVDRRLELDTRFLDRETWQRELENLRNRFAMVDFLKDYRA